MMPAPEDLALMELKQRGNKKASKPLMEKRRRARINHCLSQLKALVVDRTHNENSRQTKLEKADILELTVRHLYDLKRRQRAASLVNDPQTKQKFEMGYVECVKEVEVYLSNCAQPCASMDLQRRLRCHLLNRIKNINPGSASNTEKADTEQDPGQAFGESSTSASPEPSEDVTLIPKRLPNGDLALVIPPHILTSGSAISCPMSAFRVICNQWPPRGAHEKEASSVGSPDQTRWKKYLCNWSPSSPPSSSVSDISNEEYEDELDNNNKVNDIMENNDRTVWRPW